jgi:hypothetical protein
MMKRWGAWTLALIALLGVLVGYYGIYILLAYFAAGLVGWASIALLVSGPIGAVAAGLAWIKPRQRIAMTIGLFAFSAWLLLWILMFTVLGFKVGG